MYAYTSIIFEEKCRRKMKKKSNVIQGFIQCKGKNCPNIGVCFIDMYSITIN